MLPLPSDTEVCVCKKKCFVIWYISILNVELKTSKLKIELKFSITVLQQVISRGSKVYHLFTTLLLPDYLCNWIVSPPSSSWSPSSSSSLSSSLSLLPDFILELFIALAPPGMGAHPVTQFRLSSCRFHYTLDLHKVKIDLDQTKFVSGSADLV